MGELFCSRRSAAPRERLRLGVDSFDDHAMRYHEDYGMRAGRHNRIWDKICKESQHASLILNPIKEMPGLVPGSQSRPADVFMKN